MYQTPPANRPIIRATTPTTKVTWLNNTTFFISHLLRNNEWGLAFNSLLARKEPSRVNDHIFIIAYS
jgi:hypothetical protein